MDNKKIKDAKNGDDKAFIEIFQSLKRIILYRTKKYFFYGGDKDDVMQEAMIGLFKAINAYDENKTASFKTFALLCIKRHLITVLKNSNSRKNKILNMAIQAESEGEPNITYTHQSFMFHSPEELCLGKEKMEYVNRYLRTHLSPMENEIFEYLIAEMTYIEIAEMTGRDVKSIDNCIQRIKKKLKNFMLDY
ncbi:sigma-70 family RNA polymerase sigma factor [Fusobacterium ulcerans]|uniref:sigma-70 family RNA polymerase sigma factor n=1 Tax=Fusobacterium ulcerans TaxID=861 RepID=UPI002672A73D|nr:sigma-70 family RNA polymerase sigma factor [Fusobacterium ulcerans]